MAEKDWLTVKLPRLMIEEIDAIVKTDLAKKNGIFSRSDLLPRIYANWLANFDRDYGLFAARKPKEVDPFDDQLLEELD